MAKIIHEFSHEHECGCEHDHECGCKHDHECGCEHDHECGCEHGHAPQASFKKQEGPVFGTQPKDQGVSLGSELEADIARAMLTRYKRFLKPSESFSIKTEVCHQFGLVSAHLIDSDRTSDVQAEVSIECEPNKLDNPIEAYQLALDVLDTVLLEYFDSDRISHYLPIWQSYEIDEHTANVRLEHSNPGLDDEASAFLKAHGYTEGGLELEEEEEEGPEEASVEETEGGFEDESLEEEDETL